MEFRQAKWPEPLIFELSTPGATCFVPRPDEGVLEEIDPLEGIPREMLRNEPPNLPEVSEPQLVRHFIRLSQMSYGVDCGSYPLGSCTMKYTPKFIEKWAESDAIRWLHPYQPEETVQGLLKILYELSVYLAEITGMAKFSLQPAAGANGELTGVLIMKKYHEVMGEGDTRTEIIVPDSAHGTNPASARMGGFRVVEIPSSNEGLVDIEALKAVLSEKTAGLMLTNPNTLGLFERDILEIAKMVHEVGALLYYDGANLNAIAGIARPGDMGFDIVHLNLHKTFGTPHGGGGPGAGPVGVTEELVEFLPVPTIEFDGERYYFNYDLKHSVGKVRSFYGNIEVLVKAYLYIRLMGREGLKRAAEIAVLNSNYLLSRVRKIEGVEVPFAEDTPRKHEFVVSLTPLYRATGVRALDVAKRLLDEGVHAPTIYFPLVVKEALMIEPTESESKRELDEYFEGLAQAVKEAWEEPEKVLSAPTKTAVSRVDEAAASHPRTMAPSWKWWRSKRQL